jgi:hypothetical protein
MNEDRNSYAYNKSNCASMVMVVRNRKGKMPPPFASLAILFSVMIVIFLLNLSQMVVLDDRMGYHPLRSLLPSATFQQKNLMQQDKLRPINRKSIPVRPKGKRKDLVKAGDFIYYKDELRWDAAPIVMADYKLIFFSVPKVGCTVWKQLFRRMLGHEDWLSQDYEKLLPHNPETNGLKYLYDYSLEEANEMMTSPQWTRAMMVREPKARFLSAFLDKALSNDHHHLISTCCPDSSCVEDALTLEGFLRLVAVCHDDHWRPQGIRVDYKYWQYIDIVGHVENAAQGAKEILQRVGAWEKWGATGWGKHGNSSIFESKGVEGAGEHATWAQWEVWKWYTPALELRVEEFYRGDYENPLLNFTHYECLTCTD